MILTKHKVYTKEIYSTFSIYYDSQQLLKVQMTISE